MGLDVGVVDIEYLERPLDPIYSFLYELAGDPFPDGWGGAWEDNSILETTRRQMLKKARAYAKKTSLSKDDTDALVKWVRKLPWDGDTIMLHFGW